MKKLVAATVATAVLGLAAAGVAFAEPPERDGLGFDRPGKHGPRHIPCHARALHQVDLSDDQKAMLEDLREAGKSEREAMKEAKEAHREAMKAEVQSKKPNKQVIFDLIDEGADLEAEHRKTMIEGWLKVHATLSADQRADLVEAMGDCKPPRRGPPGRGPRRAPRDNFDL